MAIIMHVGSDETLTLTGMSAGGSYLNSGTATWALKTLAGTTIGSGSFTYTTSSNGNYTSPVESTVTSLLNPGSRYVLQVTFNQSSYDKYWAEDVWAVTDG